MGKEVVEKSIFVDDITLHIKDPKNSTEKLDTINSFSNVAE
jgi:hypothetical protein